MRKWVQTYLTVACPECGVGAGKRCFMNGKIRQVCSVVHAARKALISPEAHDAMVISKTPYGSGRNLLRDGTKSPNRTLLCNAQNHSACGGFRKQSHGFRPACLCPCHRKKRMKSSENIY